MYTKTPPRGTMLPRPVVRGLRVWVLLALLGAELLVLTTCFDSQGLSDAQPWWAVGLGYAPVLLYVGLASFTAFLVIIGPRLQRVAQSVYAAASDHRWWPWCVWHVLAFSCFFLVTAALFQTEATAIQPTLFWPVAWLLSGTLTLLLWCGTIAPTRFWRQMLQDESYTLAVAVLVGVLAWGSSHLTQALWGPLAETTFWVVRFLLGFIYPDVYTQLAGRLVGTTTFAVTIAPECSGYEGIGLVTLLFAVYLWWFRAHLRFPQALLLLPAGALAIWVANTLRITGLIVIGSSFSPAIAWGGFHSQAGWIAFLLVGLGFIFLTQRWRLFTIHTQQPPARAHTQYSMALLVPLLVLMSTMILTSAFASTVDWWYPLRVVTTGLALWSFRAVYRSFVWTWSYAAVGYGVAVFGVWMLLEPSPPPGTSAAAQELAQLSGVLGMLWLSMRVIGSVITVPIAEELAFRGYVLHKLVSQHFENVRHGQFTWVACLLSSVLFGALHGRWLAGTLAGVLYALALRQRGQLADAVVAHMVTNACIALYVLSQGAWTLWT